MAFQTVLILGKKKAHTEADGRQVKRQCWLAMNNSEHDAWCYMARFQYVYLCREPT